METPEKNKWYTQIETDQGHEILFGPTLDVLKERLLNFLLESGPTRLVILEGAEAHCVTYEKFLYGDGERGVWRSSSAQVVARDIRALYNFILQGIYIGPGPEYPQKSELIGIEDGRLRLEMIQTVMKVSDTEKVNIMMARGWRLLTIENTGEKGITYVLGHEEQRAF